MNDDAERQSLLQAIASMVHEGQRDWLFLIAVEENGRAYFMEVSRSGYDVRNAGVIFLASIVEDYGHLRDLLVDIDMQHGLADWLLQQLDDYGDNVSLLHGVIAGSKAKIKQLEKEIKRLESELERQENANDALQATLYDRGSHGY